MPCIENVYSDVLKCFLCDLTRKIKYIVRDFQVIQRSSMWFYYIIYTRKTNKKCENISK